MRPYPLATLFVVAIAPAIVRSNPVLAQVDVSQTVIGNFSSIVTSAQTRNTQASNIVISIRDFGSNDDFCGNSVSFALPRPGSFGDGFDFPHAGRQSDNFPHPGRTITTFPDSATTYFQLPVGVRNPDLIGCVDTQRNMVFITIRSQRQATPTQPPSQPNPTLPSVQPPPQTVPNNPTPNNPQTQILLPRQTPFFPVGSPNTPSIR